MFQITSLEHSCRVIPSELGRPTLEAVTSVIEQTFLDKVIANLGLAVSIYDILDIQGGLIYPSDGAAHFKAKFRLIFFRPFVGEVLTGRLVRSDRHGLKVSLDFFDDVMVPDYALMDPSKFDEAADAWCWEFRHDAAEMDEPPEGLEKSACGSYYIQDFYYIIGDEIRVRVKDVKFKKTPNPTDMKDDDLVGTAAHPFAPMEVICTINEDGLGMTAWWGGAE